MTHHTTYDPSHHTRLRHHTRRYGKTQGFCPNTIICQKHGITSIFCHSSAWKHRVTSHSHITIWHDELSKEKKKKKKKRFKIEIITKTQQKYNTTKTHDTTVLPKPMLCPTWVMAKTICFRKIWLCTTSCSCIFWVLDNFYHHKNYIGSYYTLYAIVYN